ncbi:MAG TPA: DGQHR domain-containing protein [Usitatibacter sp.]|nr:DGQHR domain-containing protein [Usitatibacter sp.]
MAFDYPCLTYKQRESEGAPSFCIFHAKATEIAEWADVDRLAPNNRTAAQRRLNPTRVEQVKRYLAADARNTIPTALLVALDGAVEVTQGENGAKLSITLTEGQPKPGLVIDGQHRLSGVLAFSGDIELTVIALLGTSEEEKAFQFLVVNNKAQKVPKSHMTALHLNYPEEALNARLRKGARMGLKEQLYELLKVVDEDDESPFKGKIAWETNREPDQWVVPAAIELSFSSIRSAERKDLEEDLWVDFYLAVWGVVRAAWGDYWKDPRGEEPESRLLHKVSIITLFAFLCAKLFGKADDIDTPLELADMEQVKAATHRFLEGLDPEYFTVKWKLGEYDTRQGRDRILRGLNAVYQFKRAKIDWKSEIDFIQAPPVAHQ